MGIVKLARCSLIFKFLFAGTIILILIVASNCVECITACLESQEGRVKSLLEHNQIRGVGCIC